MRVKDRFSLLTLLRPKLFYPIFLLKNFECCEAQDEIRDR